MWLRYTMEWRGKKKKKKPSATSASASGRWTNSGAPCSFLLCPRNCNRVRAAPRCHQWAVKAAARRLDECEELAWRHLRCGWRRKRRRYYAGLDCFRPLGFLRLRSQVTTGDVANFGTNLEDWNWFRWTFERLSRFEKVRLMKQCCPTSTRIFWILIDKLFMY